MLGQRVVAFERFWGSGRGAGMLGLVDSLMAGSERLGLVMAVPRGALSTAQTDLAIVGGGGQNTEGTVCVKGSDLASQRLKDRPTGARHRKR